MMTPYLHILKALFKRFQTLKVKLTRDNYMKNGLVALYVNILAREIWRKNSRATMFPSSNLFGTIEKDKETIFTYSKRPFLALSNSESQIDARQLHE